MTTTTTPNDLSSFYAAFRADDACLDIIPAFDYQSTNKNNYNNEEVEIDHMNLLFQSTVSSTSLIGGSNTTVKAGLTYTVPVWMAVLLQQRSFATIVYPSWYRIDNLTHILAFEKQNVSLFETTSITSSSVSSASKTTSRRRRPPTTTTGENEDDTEDDQEEEAVDSYVLPSNYYELSRRFATTSSATRSTGITGSTTNNSSSTTAATATATQPTTTSTDVLTLLIQDIYDVRMDKLRQQFQTLLYNTTQQLQQRTTATASNNHHRRGTQTDVIINVTGIGTQELAQIQPYVRQAMNDIYYLES